jgi:hypothetical protein
MMTCWQNKFLIHIVDEELFFDSNVVLLPIFVFVTCHIFMVLNLLDVVTELMAASPVLISLGATAH